MLTRDADAAAGGDLEGFFWRGVVARSPLTLVPGTPYDNAWRAINQLLVHGSIASHQRNVFLRNDGRGGVGEISGALGLDLDQDGRAFAVLDVDRDGDPDLVVMAARQAPQVRTFRKDFGSVAPEGGSHAVAIRLTGTKSNRDAIGARVTIETDRLRKTRIVQAGSGFLSQYSKELLIGLGPSERIAKLTVDWPSGGTQVFTDVPLNARVSVVEAGGMKTAPLAAPVTPPATAVPSAPSPPAETWFYEPFPAPDFSLPDLSGATRSIAALKGKPAIVLLFLPEVPASRTALETLARGAQTLAQAGVQPLAIALDSTGNQGGPRLSSSAAVPIVTATPAVG